MSPTDPRIEATVNTFVSDISALLRTAALEALAGILGERASAPVRASLSGPRPKARPAAEVGAAKKRVAKARGGKRSSTELARLTDNVHTYIRKNRGQGAEAIAIGLKRTTRDLALPIRKLLAERKIEARGQRRGTRYF